MLSENEYKTSAERVWEMYKNGLLYQSNTKLRENVARFIDYYEGHQWSAPTKGTEAMPRLVLNYIKKICRAKKSSILSTPFKLTFTSLKDKEKASRFSKFYEYKYKEIGMDEKNEQCVECGIKTGFYCMHFFWDVDSHSQFSIHKGNVSAEVIDATEFFCSNPCELDVQKQQWILFSSRQSVDSLRNKADKDVDINLIKPDVYEDNAFESIEQEGSKLCTVLTRYFRVNGEVYCERSTKSCVINNAFPITPNVKKYENILNKNFNQEYNDCADAPDVDSPDAPKSEVIEKENVLKATLYPVALFSYDERKNCIYGIGEIEGNIPNQQAINMIYSMSAYSVEMLAWGKWKVTPKALNGQDITNEPGQILTDYDSSGDGIKRITGDPVNSAPVSIAGDIISKMREVVGSTEVSNGEVLGADMSGSAIAQLQSVASQLDDEIRKRFWKFQVQIGKVLEQFFRLYYDTEPFISDELTEDNKVVSVEDLFVANEYKDIDFKIICEATGGTRATSAGDISFLESLYAKGELSASDFCRLYPENALSNKNDILLTLKNQETNIVAKLQQQLAQYKSDLDEASKLMQKQGEVINNVNSIINQNNALQATLAEVVSKCKSKEQLANVAIAKYAEVYGDAMKFAEALSVQNGTNLQPKIDSDESVI